MKSSRIVKSKSQSVNLNEIISILRIKIITLRLLCRHFLLHSKLFDCVKVLFRKTLINYCQKTRDDAHLASFSGDLLLYHWHFIL